MRPVLEQATVVFKQSRQPLGTVAGLPRKQNHMVRTLERADAVDLDEADALDQFQQGGFVLCRTRQSAKTLVMEKETACLAMAEDWAGDGHAPVGARAQAARCGLDCYRL